MFESFRKSLNELLDRATPPEERRALASRMRDTLVQAKIGLGDLRDTLELSRKRLAAEQRELETTRRRKALAERIDDAQTVQLATKYEAVHAERVAVLQRKIEVQERELMLAEHDVEEMTSELRMAMSGSQPATARAPSSGASPSADGDQVLDESAPAREELDALARARARSEREADADRRLDELKRRMGK